MTRMRSRVWRRAAGVLTVGLAGIAPSAPSFADESSFGSLEQVAQQVGADELWASGVTGSGVNVAIIDTGVAPVGPFASSGSLVAAVDVSAEQVDPTTAFVDTNGHGTHLAGIINGVAPGAGIVSVKVAGRDGDVTLASLVTGIDWVIAHSDELNIRVLNLAFNSDANRPYHADPLAVAVERAWAAGIVVVTAAGNEGADANGISAPANDPYVIAVAGVEATADGFVVPDWASSGDGQRDPDFAAPGAHIESLRAPGSNADLNHPEGYVDEETFRGSGSSQSAAVVSGVAALLLDARPELTPDQAKSALASSTSFIVGASPQIIGSGVVRADAAVAAAVGDVHQVWRSAQSGPRSGRMSGVSILSTGTSWTGTSWTGTSWTGTSWTGTSWTGTSWTGTSWTGTSWTGTSWTGTSWTGTSWTGTSWTGTSWTGTSWTGTSWTGTSWTGTSWTGTSWTGTSWTGTSWT